MKNKLNFKFGVDEEMGEIDPFSELVMSDVTTEDRGNPANYLMMPEDTIFSDTAMSSKRTSPSRYAKTPTTQRTPLPRSAKSPSGQKPTPSKKRKTSKNEEDPYEKACNEVKTKINNIIRNLEKEISELEKKTKKQKNLMNELNKETTITSKGRRSTSNEYLRASITHDNLKTELQYKLTQLESKKNSKNDDIERECKNIKDEILAEQNPITITLFDFFDKIKLPPTNSEELKIHRARQYLTFYQLVLFDIIKDMHASDVENRIKNRFYTDMIELYKEDMIYYLQSKFPNQVINNVWINGKIYPYTDDESAEAYMFQIFDLDNNVYKSNLLSTPPDKTLGMNVANIYAIQVLEIFGLKLQSFYQMNMFLPDKFKNIVEFMKIKQNITEDIKQIDLTVDTIGYDSYYSTLIPLLMSQQRDYQNIIIKYYKTPGKYYDPAGDPKQLFDKNPKIKQLEVDSIYSKGTTFYNIQFDNNTPFVKCKLSNKLEYNNLNSKDICGNSSKNVSCSKNVIAAKIKEVYDGSSSSSTDNRKKIRDIAYFKFLGDFLQSVWHGVLQKDNFEPYKGFIKTIPDESQIKLGQIKIHIADDTISSAFASLFGGVVVTSGTKFHNLYGNLYGGTEFYYVPTGNVNFPDLPHELQIATQSQMYFGKRKKMSLKQIEALIKMIKKIK